MQDDILRHIQHELGQAEVLDVDEAADYFNAQRPLPMDRDDQTSAEDAVKWSEVVYPEVRNAVIATLAEVMPGFFSDQPVEFPPTAPEDEQQAEVESRLVSHVVFDIAKGFESLMRAMQDGYLYRAGAVQIYWLERAKVVGQRIESVPEDVVIQMLNENPELSAEERKDKQGWDVDQFEHLVESRPVVEWVPIDELRVDKNQTLVDLDDARFVSRVRLMTKSELIALGFDKDVVDAIAPYGGSVSVVDESAQEVMVAESHILFDTDGDGIAERRKVMTAGGSDGDQVLLDDRPWDEQPFALGVPYFGLKNWQGISLYDRLKVLQDLRTDLLRQIVDTGWRNLIGRFWGLEMAFNPNDLAASRRGGMVRVNTPQAIGPLPDAQLSPMTFQLLQSLVDMRRESGGGAVDTAPQIQQMGGDTAHGIERLVSAIEQTNALSARIMAETLMKSTYRKVHRLLRKHWQGVLQKKQTGRWLVEMPQQWSPRDNVEVRVGLSLGDRRAQAQQLDTVIARQIEALAQGRDGVLVDLPQLHNAFLDQARFLGLSAPEQYWIDPQSPPAQQAAQAKQQQMEQQQQMAQQAAQQAAQQQAELLVTIENIKAEVDKYKVDWDHVAKVNEQFIKLLDLSARHTTEDINDVEQFAGAINQKGQSNGEPVRHGD
jgi:hypothetical protein